MEIPADHKYYKELDEFKSICCNVLSKGKSDPEKNSVIQGILSEYLNGNSDALHMLRSAKKLMWLPPQRFLITLINQIETNRAVWYGAHWLKKQSA